MLGATTQAQTFDGLGYRYIYDLFTTADHFTLATNDQYAPAASFLGTHRVDRNPAHVSYVVNPVMDFPAAGTVADHAYWISGLRLRDASGNAPLGKVDARSEAFGSGDAVANPTQTRPGTLQGGNLPDLAYVERFKTWGAAPQRPSRDVLHLDARNLSQVVVHVARARLSCHPQLHVTTDGPLTVDLAGCNRTIHFGS